MCHLLPGLLPEKLNGSLNITFCTIYGTTNVSLYAHILRKIMYFFLNFHVWLQQFSLVHCSTIRGHHSTDHAHPHLGCQRGSAGTGSSPASVLSHHWWWQFTVRWSSACWHPANDLLGDRKLHWCQTVAVNRSCMYMHQSFRGWDVRQNKEGHYEKKLCYKEGQI